MQLYVQATLLIGYLLTLVIIIINLLICYIFIHVGSGVFGVVPSRFLWTFLYELVDFCMICMLDLNEVNSVSPGFSNL